jgi:hypothetical protein
MNVWGRGSNRGEEIVLSEEVLVSRLWIPV